MRSLEGIRLVAVAAIVWSAIAGSAFADEAEGHYRMGLALERKGNLPEATREVKEAVRLKPDHAAAWLTLGSLQRKLNDFASAEKSFDKVIVLAPKQAQAYALSGAVLIRLNKLEQAVERLRKATELDKEDFQSVANLGVALRKLGRNAEAIKVMEDAVRQRPDDPELLNNLGDARMTTLTDINLQHAVELKPNDLELRRNLAITLRGVERYKDAVPHYEAVLAAQPNDVGMLYDLANCHEKSGDNAKAIAVYKRYVQAIRAKDAAAAERGEARIKALEKSAF